MRGKSLTCRTGEPIQQVFDLAGGVIDYSLMGSLSASQRLAAHRVAEPQKRPTSAGLVRIITR
jgi:hypothetical protein